MMLTLRDGLEMPASLGSLTIHFRHMTENVCERERGGERKRNRLGGTEPGQVSRVTSHVVLSSRGLSIDRGWTDRCDGSRGRKNIASDN